MTFTYTALLSLGLTLCLRTTVCGGDIPKPILRVRPNSVVYKETAVTFLCEGTNGAKAYKLYKKENSYGWSSDIQQNPKKKSEFSISEVAQQHAAHYYCRYQTGDQWSEYSDFLELVVTGIYSKPRLSAQPSPVLAPGGNVTFKCASKQQYDRFILREGLRKLSWIMDSQYNHSSGQFEALFSLDSLAPNQRWIFRCYSNYRNKPQVWSERSYPVKLLFSGIYYSKPNLTALPSPVVTSGGNITLQCVSWGRYEKFILTKEDQFLRSLDSKYIHSVRQYHAFFSIDHMTTNHTGTFRCYGYYKNTSHLLFVPSDPLELHISASEKRDQTVENLVRMGFAGLILIVLGVLMCEAWHSKRLACETAGNYSEIQRSSINFSHMQNK